MKAPWQGLAGAALGAALVVTVYEGKVLFAGGRGADTPVSAGQALTVGVDGKASLTDTPAGPAIAAEVPAPPGADASREELLRRDEAERGEIAQLRARVRQLEAGGAGGGPGLDRLDSARDASGRPWFDPSSDDLKRFAGECRVRYDLPPLERQPAYGPQLAADAGLSQEELAAVNQAIAQVAERYLAQLRQLYVAVTGDGEHADDLSAPALMSEIQNKSPEGEEERINQRIALERAGLAQPPGDLSKLSPIEQFMRLQATIGDETEKAVAAVIGQDRARALRAMHGGWGNRREMAGCPGDEDAKQITGR